MKLTVHRLEDSKYDINWVIANNEYVMINRHYIERHEPVYSGFSIIAQNPDDPEWLMEYGQNEEGILSVSDFTKSGRVYEVMLTDIAIKCLAENTEKVLKKMMGCKV